MQMAPDTAHMQIKLAPLTMLAQDSLTVFGAAEACLPKVCAYENVHEYSKPFAAHLLRDIYIHRAVSFDSIDVVTLPPGTVVHGDADYLTTAGSIFLKDQFHRDWHPPVAPRVLANTAPAIAVAGDVLLLSRYGALTWGHWLGEILPRAVVAEFIAPGKYRFAVPEAYRAGASANYLASLRAYGIGEDRLIYLGQHRYAFERLAAVSPMWIYPYAIHPAALALLRVGLKQPIPRAPHGAETAAMLRSQGEAGRHIRNLGETLDFLKIKGFIPFPVAAMPFIEQVALFREAKTVFGVLGSNLTGLIYSPLGVRTVSAAPGDWGDCFFHGLLQAQKGFYADLRGTPEPGYADMMTAPFTLSLARLAEALDAVGALVKNAPF